MKWLAGLAVAASLASSAAAAAAAPAPVYLLRSSAPPSSADTTATPPSVPRQVARQILLQRLGASDGASFAGALPRGFDPQTALDLINQFGGKTAPALLAEDDDAAAARRREMLVVVQGATPAHAAALEAALPSGFAAPAFSVADPPSEAANTRLFVDELAGEGIAAQLGSAVADAVAAGRPEAWARGVFVGLYDVKKDAATVDALVAALPQIVSLVQAGVLDAAILLLPESSRYAQWKQWASSQGLLPNGKTLLPPKKHAGAAGAELRRRAADAELVMADDAPLSAKEVVAGSEQPGGSSFANAAAAPIPACFQSFNACMAATGSCSEHGTCVDKFAVNSGGVAAKGSCFVCHCFSTLNRPEDSPGGLSTTQWAGSMCHKKDVSVPFWLLTGFSVALVGAVSFAIGLLFSVGEEKLPGVIGAGVSRAK